MPTNPTEADDRLPTSGPDTETYDQYQAVATGNGDLLIYDTEVGEAWVKSTVSLTLDEWR